MKKFRLDLEDLAIDSFATLSVPQEKGTVRGAQCTCDYTCEGFVTKGGPNQPCVICG